VRVGDQKRRGPFQRVSILRGVLLLVAIALSWPAERARAEDTPRRVLILSAFNYTFPAATQAIDGIERRLRERGGQKFAIDAEFLDLVRVTDPEHELRTANFVREKYARKLPDVVIAVGGAALQFTMKYRDILAPRIPVVFAGVSPETYAAIRPPSDTTGVLFKLEMERTLELAESLQPQAHQLFVISGNSALEDRGWQEASRRTIEQHQRKFETTYLFGHSLEALVAEVSRIPRDAIVIFLTFLIDGNGKSQVPRHVVKEIARVSPAPVYGPYDTYIGNGVVGGFVETFDSHGAAAADLVFEIAGGKDPATLPPRTNPAQAFRVDVRAMDRWGLKQSNLPPGTTVLFHKPSIWEQHRYLISAIALVLVLQSAAVAALLFQRRRRRQAEISLRESEDRMTFTAASVNVGLWQFDRTTNELWATEHCRAMFGLARDIHLTREVFMAAIHPADRRLAEAALRGVVKGQSAMADVRIVRPDGQERWIRVRARSHLDERGTSHQLNGIFVDITDRKTAESEAELQRQQVTHLMRVSVLGELSGAIAHEVNQPLTAILSNAQAALYMLAQNSPNLAEIRDALQDIVQEDNRAGDVVQRLRGLLKKGDVRSEPVNVNDIVGQTLALLKSELIDRRIAAETDLTDVLPDVSGDPVQLQQVMLNLVMNAMDAMASTPVAERLLTISTRVTPEQIIRIRVKDCGPGFKATKNNKLFEPFYTTKEHGLGLGLTICSTIVRAHGGEISLSNDDTGGAVAEVALPACVMLMAAQ
jgi:PAS domain S-box-containing protein